MDIRKKREKLADVLGISVHEIHDTDFNFLAAYNEQNDCYDVYDMDFHFLTSYDYLIDALRHYQ